MEISRPLMPFSSSSTTAPRSSGFMMKLAQAAGVYLSWYMKIGIALFPFSCDMMFVGFVRTVPIAPILADKQIRNDSGLGLLLIASRLLLCHRRSSGKPLYPRLLYFVEALNGQLDQEDLV